MKLTILALALLFFVSDPCAQDYKGIVANSLDISLSAPSDQTTSNSTALIEMSDQNEALADAQYWAGNGAVRWNEFARQLIIKNKPVSGPVSRAFALLSVAQFDAANIVAQLQKKFARKGPKGALTYPSVNAAIAQASADILSYVYPRDKEMLARSAKESANSAVVLGTEYSSDALAGLVVGAKVAELVIARAKLDRSDDSEWKGKPKQEGVWFPVGKPGYGNWGKVKPWLTDDITQFRAPAPPAWGSEEFNKALAEVKMYSDQQNARRLTIAQYWDQPRGSLSVPGMWNDFACEYALEDKLSALDTARVLAYLNMAMMDAGISSWDTKFHYLVVRPSQAMKGIDLPLGLPNHPSYTSGHASFSGAGDGVLSGFFPKRAEKLHAMADEASLSRVYGGVHYLFDGIEGLNAGRKIAAVALKQAGVNG